MASAAECTHLTLKETWAFIISLEDGSADSRGAGFLAAWWCSAVKVAGSLWSTALYLAVFLYYLLVGIVKLGTGAMPHVIFYSSKVVAFHREQLGWMDLMFEAIVIASVTTFYIFHGQIMAYIHKLEKQMAKSSRLAKTRTHRLLGVAPHFAFFVVSLLFAFFGRKFLAPISSLRVLPLCSLVLPVATTCWSCLSMRNTAFADMPLSDLPPMELQRLASDGRSKTLLWIVLMVYHGGATLLGLLPFSHYLLNKYLPFLRQIALVVLVFAQISPLFSEIVFEVASPVLNWFAERIPSSSAEEERGMRALSVMSSMGIITSRTESVVKALFVEGTSLLIMVFFCFFPTRLSNIGVVILALLLPGIRASTTVRAWEQISATPAPTARPGAAAGGGNENSTWNTVVEVTRSTSSGLLAALRDMSPMQVMRSSTAVRFSATEGGDEANSATASASASGEVEAEVVEVSATQAIATEVTEADQEGVAGLATRSSSNNVSSAEERQGENSPLFTQFTIGAFSSGRKIRKNSAETCALIRRQLRWLEYFVCLGAMWTLRCYGIGLWPSLTMALCWWLSHSIMAGAHAPAAQITKLVEFVPELITPVFSFRMLRGGYRYLKSAVFGGTAGEPLLTPLHGSAPAQSDGSPGSEYSDDQSGAPNTPWLDSAGNATSPAIGSAGSTSASTSSARRRHTAHRRSGSATSTAEKAPAGAAGGDSLVASPAAESVPRKRSSSKKRN